MKKIFCILLAAWMAACLLTACGDPDRDQQTGENTTAALPVISDNDTREASDAHTQPAVDTGNLQTEETSDQTQPVDITDDTQPIPEKTNPENDSSSDESTPTELDVDDEYAVTGEGTPVFG